MIPHRSIFDVLVNVHDTKILSAPRMNTPEAYKNVGSRCYRDLRQPRWAALRGDRNDKSGNFGLFTGSSNMIFPIISSLSF
jgi:hypothetical protein